LEPINGAYNYHPTREAGNEIMKSTVAVVTTALPLNLGRNLGEKVSSFAAKKVIKTIANSTLDATTASTNTQKSTSYTIKQGDTLSQIAKQFNTSIDTLAQQNNIKDVNKIEAGDNLKITTPNTTGNN
jgi:LysM repeat protein